MLKVNNLKFLILVILIPTGIFSQGIKYKFKSKVVVRNWKLSSKAYTQETIQPGVTIELFEGTKSVSKTTSDKDGNFGFDLPCIGNFTMVISGQGLSTRKFSLNCNSIVIKNGQSDFIPSIDITGFVSANFEKDVSSVGLSGSGVQMTDEKNNVLKYGGLNFPVNINDGDVRIIQKFCTCNKLGDLAYQNKNFALAKNYYMMANNIIEGEEYPNEQLKRTDDAIKEKNFADRTEKPKNYGRGKSSKKAQVTQAPVNPQLQGSPKNNTGGRKTLPVLGGKK